jgi:DNA-binding protein H-NS
MKENKLSLCYDFFGTATRKERRTMADELKKIQEKLDKIYSLLASKTIATEFSSPQSAKTPDASVRSSRPAHVKLVVASFMQPPALNRVSFQPS